MYITNDGKAFWSPNDRQFVKDLQNASYSPTNSTIRFMEDVARRAHIQTGRTIRTGKIMDFVQDLKDAGLLIQVNVS